HAVTAGGDKHRAVPNSGESRRSAADEIQRERADWLTDRVEAELDSQRWAASASRCGEESSEVVQQRGEIDHRSLERDLLDDRRGRKREPSAAMPQATCREIVTGRFGNLVDRRLMSGAAATPRQAQRVLVKCG